MKLQEIKLNDIKDGDIIYAYIDPELNDFIGDDYLLTDTDMFLIVDDASALSTNNEILTNGGFLVSLRPDLPVFKIGTYASLLREITKLSGVLASAEQLAELRLKSIVKKSNQ